MDAYQLRVEALERAESLLSRQAPDSAAKPIAAPLTTTLRAYDTLLVRLERHAARQRRMDAALSARERRAAERDAELSARERKVREADRRVAEAQAECAEIRAALEERSRDHCVREAERAEALAEICARVERLI